MEYEIIIQCYIMLGSIFTLMGLIEDRHGKKECYGDSEGWRATAAFFSVIVWPVPVAVHIIRKLSVED